MSNSASTIIDDSTSSAHLFQKIVVLGNRARIVRILCMATLNVPWMDLFGILGLAHKDPTMS
jgi:hypothetical protein